MRKSRLIDAGCALLSLGTLWGLWEWAGRSSWKYASIFPPPTIFMKRIADTDFKIGLGSQAATISDSIIASVLRVLSGLLIAFVAGTVTAALISSSRWVGRFVMPVVRLLAPIAPIAWIPMALVLFGIGNSTAIFVVFMGVFFTLTIGTLQAIETVPQDYIEAAQTLGCRGVRLWTSVKGPYILPQAFTVLRLNFIAAWMAVLAAEMTGLRDGLGAVIMVGRNLFDNNLILLGMTLIGGLGFAIDLALRVFQRELFPWSMRR